VNDLNFHIESIAYSATSDKLTFHQNQVQNQVIAVIGAQRLGSLYFDVSLLSDYPQESEVIMGPSDHLEIRNLIINGYDMEIYFDAIYIMDALIGHKLSFDFKQNESNQMYLCQIIENVLNNDDIEEKGGEFGQKICSHYWSNKTRLRWNIKQFIDDISAEQLEQLFLIKHQHKETQDNLISFHFINGVILFPNVEEIQIDHIDLNVFVCDDLLQFMQTLNNNNDYGHNLNKIQLFGDENNKHYLQFIDEPR